MAGNTPHGYSGTLILQHQIPTISALQPGSAKKNRHNRSTVNETKVAPVPKGRKGLLYFKRIPSSPGATPGLRVVVKKLWSLRYHGTVVPKLLNTHQAPGHGRAFGHGQSEHGRGRQDKGKHTRQPARPQTRSCNVHPVCARGSTAPPDSTCAAVGLLHE